MSLAATWGLLAGCGADPTATPDTTAEPPAESPAATPAAVKQADPSPEAAVAGTARLARAPSAALDLSDEIGDLTQRVLPGFHEERAAHELRDALVTLGERVRTGDRPGAMLAIAAARGVLRAGSAGDADLDAVRLTLDAMQRAVGAAPTAAGPHSHLDHAPEAP
jgi:hypothetical protein